MCEIILEKRGGKERKRDREMGAETREKSQILCLYETHSQCCGCTFLFSSYDNYLEQIDN